MQNPQLYMDALSGQFHPVVVPGEVFLLSRKHMHFAATFIDENGTSQHVGVDGHIVLSTLRIVFVVDKEKMGPGFQAFDIPISLISKEGFKQPIFGSNYLFGDIAKWRVGPSTFKLYFYNGGSGVFLKTFINLLTKHRDSAMARDSEFVERATTGVIQRKIIATQTYVDPSDPTMVFMTQPGNIRGGNVQMCELIKEPRIHDGNEDANLASSSSSSSLTPSTNNITDLNSIPDEITDNSKSRQAVTTLVNDQIASMTAESHTNRNSSTISDSVNDKQHDAASASEGNREEQSLPEPIIIPTWIARREEQQGYYGTRNTLRRRLHRAPRYDDYVDKQVR